MWNHYSDGYAGICFQYDSASLNSIKPVVYTKQLPEQKNFTIQFIKTMIETPYVSKNMRSLEILFTIYGLFKTYDWRYENEWRLINPDMSELQEKTAPQMPADKAKVLEEFIESKLYENPNWSIEDMTFEELKLFDLSQFGVEGTNNIISSEPQTGKLYDETVKPVCVYLGHRLEEEDKEHRELRNSIIKLAEKNNIEVRQMRRTNGGYTDYSLDEIDKLRKLDRLAEIKKLIMKSDEEAEINEETLVLCNEGINLDLNDAEIYNLRGHVYSKISENIDKLQILNRAKNDFRIAAKMDPIDYLCYGNLASVLCDIATTTGDNAMLSEAHDNAIHSLSLFNGYSRGYILLCSIAVNLNDIKQAIAWLEEGYKMCNKEIFIKKLIDSDDIKKLLISNSDFSEAYMSLSFINHV
jgi:tetratricopeptide (TPR) repeat protein